MYVIGTAGHVDHGKSTLVEALTGIDPDRLAEEKEREMTIDLGFAWINLASSPEAEGDLAEVGIVDVPGHRDFIENMLAGVGGIDLALFVVAADEGVMPQTEEHLAILDLLEIPGGVIALTKIDLVDDPDWLELVTLDLSENLSGTVLADAPIIPVSARTGKGLGELRQALAEALAATDSRADSGRARLPIDRVFTLSGFGTVVTGTLVGGSLQVGDIIEIQPANLQGRVRGLQTHKTKRQVALPGSRVAVNVTGIDTDEVQRGDVLASPGVARGTLLFDAVYRHLPQAAVPLRHNMEVKLFLGAAEIMARTRVLGARQINPGEEGWLQLALQQPVAAVRGDRFILRRPSPGTTLGGGRVLDPHPGRRHRRFRPQVVERLHTLAEGTPAELLLQKLCRLEPVSRQALLQQAGMDATTAKSAWEELLAEGAVVQVGQQVLSKPRWQQLRQQLLNLLEQYHQEKPLRLGMSREELRSRLRLPAAIFNALLAELMGEGMLQEERLTLHLPQHQIRFDTEQERQISALMDDFARAGINSPSVKQAQQAVGEAVYEGLVDLGRLHPVSEDVVYRDQEYEQLVDRIVDYLRRQGSADTGQVRDLLQTSRKYAIALLEHLDDVKVTRRVGDRRELTVK